MMRRCLLFAGILALVIPILLSLLIRSETGSRWLLQNAFSFVPGQITATTIQGRLLDHIVLSGLHYQSDTESVIAEMIDFTWQPVHLLSGTLKVDDISISGLNISLNKAEAIQKENLFTETDFKLPIQLDIGNLLITDVQFTYNGQVQTLEKLQLAAKSEDDQFKLISLHIQSDQINATAKGKLTLEKNFPLTLQADWQLKTERNGAWQGHSTINGGMDKLFFANHLASPFKLILEGHVDNVLNKPYLTAQGNWQNVIWPIAANPPQIQSPEGHFEVAGLFSDYHLTLNGQLRQRYVPKATIVFDGKGGLDTMIINKLELQSSTGLFQLKGRTSWEDNPAFDLSASGQEFNPAIVIPELLGNINFSSRITGKLVPNNLQIAVDIDQLTGSLRKQAVFAKGKLALTGTQLKVDTLRINSGANKIAVDGMLEPEKGKLEFFLNMPSLNTLWPSLGGSLTGKGQINGGWKNPAIQLDAQGKQLKLAQHKLKGLAVNLDYHPDNQNRSTLIVAANTLNIDAIQVSQLTLNGKGTLRQHTLQADIASPHGVISTALAGNWIEPRWKADISKLNITPKDDNSWSLKDNLLLQLEKKPTGIDLAINEGCLEQQSASLCFFGSYLANSDLNFKLKAKAMPTGLFQAFLPDKMIVKSLIDGNVALQRKMNVLTGSYQADATPIRVFIPNPETLQEFQLGASTLSGNIKGDKISADFNVKLANQDYVQGKFVSDIGKNQALSAKLNAAITDFTLIKPFVPQLSEIKGLLKADLSVQGSTRKPWVAGRIDYSDGLIESDKFGLKQITLVALALDNRSNAVHIQGSATPIIRNQTNATKKISLTSKLNLDADLQIQDVKSGNFRLTTPANSTLSITSHATQQEIVLGATSLSGQFKDEALSAVLDMDFLKQDKLHGNLQLNMGKSQALSGQASASIREFALLEAFIPELSDIKGLLKVDMSMSGTQQNPLLTGNMQLNEGIVAVDQYGIKVHDIHLQALASELKSDQIEIKGSAKSGEGLVNLSGMVSLAADNDYPVELTLKGKDFEVAKIPEAQITVSPDLDLKLTREHHQVSGQLDIPKAILAIQEIPENAVKVSADEVILGEEKQKDNNMSPAPAINADIEVRLGKQVSFSGQGLRTNLIGNLKIQKSGEKMAMQGKVDMEKAKYKRFGQDLTVRKGRFLFNGPADNPWLDVEAIRISKNKKVTALLSLSGTLKNPKTRISSEPSLPETEALAYLITGGPLNRVSKGEGNMLANAALSYGAGKATWLTEKLGIDEFEVEEGANLKDSLLVMGEYLTPDFYVGTRIGMFNKQASIVLKHKITDTINLESQAGTSQRIKLNYEFDTE